MTTLLLKYNLIVLFSLDKKNIIMEDEQQLELVEECTVLVGIHIHVCLHIILVVLNLLIEYILKIEPLKMFIYSSVLSNPTEFSFFFCNISASRIK